MSPAQPVPGTREMFELVAALPGQLAASADLPGLAEAGNVAGKVNRIVLCGMGGSAIAGDLAAPLLAGSGVSLTVWRDYGLPHWVTADDLVICSSYSGETEETLSGAAEAGGLGCRRVVISTGGTLGELAADDDLPTVVLPSGLPPRASLGYGLGALVRLWGRWGLVSSAEVRLEKAIRELERLGPARDRQAVSATADPEATLSVAGLAEALADRIPVIYTAGREAHAAGVRLRAQLNENSKVPAFLAAFPELDHNDLEGWDVGRAGMSDFVLLTLVSPNDDPRLERRVDVTLDLLGHQFAAVHRVTAAADEPLARILSLVQFGDFLSCHLACRRGVDALPVERISQLKQALGDPEGDATQVRQEKP